MMCAGRASGETPVAGASDDTVDGMGDIFRQVRRRLWTVTEQMFVCEHVCPPRAGRPGAG